MNAYESELAQTRQRIRDHRKTRHHCIVSYVTVLRKLEKRARKLQRLIHRKDRHA